MKSNKRVPRRLILPEASETRNATVILGLGGHENYHLIHAHKMIPVPRELRDGAYFELKIGVDVVVVRVQNTHWRLGPNCYTLEITVYPTNHLELEERLGRVKNATAVLEDDGWQVSNVR